MAHRKLEASSPPEWSLAIMIAGVRVLRYLQLLRLHEGRSNYVSIGQYEQALAHLQEALRLAPDNVFNYSNLGETYLFLNI